jgi:hypothetical protein
MSHMPYWRLALLLSLLCAGSTYAASVLKVDRTGNMVAVLHAAGQSFSVQDYLCVVDGEEALACGYVTKVMKRGSILKFDYRSGRTIKKGLEVVRFPARIRGRGPAEATADTVEKLDQIRKAPAEAPVEPSPTDSSPPPAAAETPSAVSEAPPPPKQKDQTDKILEQIKSSEAPVKPAAAPAETSAPRTASKKSTSQETEAVNLDNLEQANVVPESGEVASAPVEAGTSKAKVQSPHHRLGTKPSFVVLFDTLLTYRPGVDPSTTFDNYHTILLMEYMPTPKLYFGFEVNPVPRYFEMDYQLLSFLQLRAGRIYIPFDDLSPHSVFGGRANVSKMIPPGAVAFLPDIWTDLGLGVKFSVLDSRAIKLDVHLYVTNGFGEGGVDPFVPPAPSYPDFSQIPNQDNNTDKAMGARVHMSLWKDAIGLGASAYRCRYTADSDPEGDFYMLGIDGQLHLGGTELRGGLVYMNVSLPAPSTNFLRGGVYGELTQDLVRHWKVRARFGVVQNDSRVTTNSDMINGGGSILWHPGPVQLSFEFDQDFYQVTTKVNYTYVGLRLSFGV